VFEMYSRARGGHAGGGGGLMLWVRRLVVLAFAVIQLFLVARILLDLGVIPEDGFWGDLIIPVSDALAAPVEGISDALGDFLGGQGAIAGEEFNPVMLAALAAWTVVEGLVMRVVSKFEAV
jgi:hypothetical protein